MRALALALLALAAPASARITAADLRRHIAILADDAMAGRKPGTPGGDAAATYIAGRFAAAGLRPGAPDGGWYAPVALVERRPLRLIDDWSVAGRPITIAADQRVLVGARSSVRLPPCRILFVGHGIVDAQLGVDNLAGLDLAGAVVLMLPGKPKGLEAAPGTAARREALFRRGAAAVLLAVRDEDAWAAIRDGIAAGETLAGDAFIPPIDGAIALPAWRRLLALDPAGQAALIRQAGEKDFVGRPTAATLGFALTSAVRRYDSWNVMGKRPGTRPAAGALFYLAHWDHLGVCAPGKPDPICNGAVDNASGVAMLIEIAQQVAAGPPLPRDLWFVATTAEEMGLLGAKALAARPPVPLPQIATVLNFDTVAIMPAGAPIAVIGRGKTPLDPMIDATARAVGRKVSASLDANTLISRQDGWAFTQVGVPAVMVGGSFADMPVLEDFLGSIYHKPNDDLTQPLVLDGAAEDADYHVALARVLADPAKLPAPR